MFSFIFCFFFFCSFLWNPTQKSCVLWRLKIERLIQRRYPAYEILSNKKHFKVNRVLISSFFFPFVCSFLWFFFLIFFSLLFVRLAKDSPTKRKNRKRTNNQGGTRNRKKQKSIGKTENDFFSFSWYIEKWNKLIFL